MKTRESGMPDEPTWSAFFDVKDILVKLGLPPADIDVVDFGCGYGTFTIPAARITRGVVYALDIETAMVEATTTAAEEAGLSNVRVEERDLFAEGTGLPVGSVGYAMLFNILHCEQPDILLHEAWRVLSPGGRLGIMHWNPDRNTPRGPSMNIRPRPEQCRAWAEHAGFELRGPERVDLPPYHYGLMLGKPE